MWLLELIVGVDDGVMFLVKVVVLMDLFGLVFMYLLEDLVLLECVVFMLCEVFDYDYSEIVRIVEKSEVNCC